jgi:probable HAF family extracellular repeat protein
VTTPDAQVLADAPAMVGYDLNNAGVMTGDKQIDSQTKPVRWTADGGVEELSLGAQGVTGYSYDINEHGDSVGQIGFDDNRVVPALWRADGTLVELGIPDWLPYDYARAFAINDSGTVVGNASLLRQEDDGFWHEYNDPFIWTEADGFRRLPHIGADRNLTEPFAVNNDGWVVGHSMDAGEDHLVLWSPEGEIEDLGNLPGMSGGIAAGISSDGTVVGTSGDDAFVWTRADGMHRLADYGFDASASKVTSDGWVMGSAEIAPFEETPVIWDPQGRVYDVYGMVDPASIYPVQAMGLNDEHQLLVYGYVGDGSGLQLLQLPALP